MEAISMHVGGIKCDAENCNYEDNTALLGNYKEYVNKPCPECGANLLTQEDMDAVHHMFALADMLNAAVGPVDPDEPQGRVHLDMCGDGSVTIGEIEHGFEQKNDQGKG